MLDTSSQSRRLLTVVLLQLIVLVLGADTLAIKSTSLKLADSGLVQVAGPRASRIEISSPQVTTSTSVPDAPPSVGETEPVAQIAIAPPVTEAVVEPIDPRVDPVPKPPSDSSDPVAIGRQMNAARFGDAEWPALYRLWAHESSWNPNDVSGSACGLPQADPCAKIADRSVSGQIQWGLDYIAGTYGTPSQALEVWLSRSHECSTQPDSRCGGSY